ncbi:MAG TPA: neuraminidase-like domain-containing protein, partial [Bacteroidia bacterium]|nr:neuraminidase-like domain-containing protein [Bacteroidia bacterium]
MKSIKISRIDSPTKADVQRLHKAFSQFRVEIAEDEIKNMVIGETTIQAITAIQSKYGLSATGSLNDETLVAINKELFDTHYAFNKIRTAKIQQQIIKIPKDILETELRERIVGDSTRARIAEFKAGQGLESSSLITEEFLNKLIQVVSNNILKGSKTQVARFHKMLFRIAKIAKVEINISDDELNNKFVGPTTEEAIRILQGNYKLEGTGVLDAATIHVFTSVNASKGLPVEILKKGPADVLKRVVYPLRHNKVSLRVNDLQKALAFLKYRIYQKEFNTNTFGNSTYKAVMAFQKNHRLTATGHVDAETAKVLNKLIARSNPKINLKSYYRIRGSVRNESGIRINGIRIQIFEKVFNAGAESVPLADQINHKNGFFDIRYTAPINSTGKIKNSFNLLVKFLDSDGNILATQTHFNVKQTHWINLNRGSDPYQGDSEFATRMRLIISFLNGASFEDLEETEEQQDISHLSSVTELNVDDIMKLYLSHRASTLLATESLTAEAIYAFIRQNQPPSLPGELLASTNEWDSIEQLIENAATGIVFLDTGIQQQVIDNAYLQNFVSLEVKSNRETILQDLSNLKVEFTLLKPLLIGNGTLQSLLEESTIASANYDAVANLVIQYRGLNKYFWVGLNGQSATIGAAEIEDFRKIVDLANLTKNHLETITFLKSQIGSGQPYPSSASLAKLSDDEWIAIIHDNADQVPDNIPGDTTEEKVANYAASLHRKAEKLFPAVALVAKVKAGSDHGLNELTSIESFIDDNPNLDLRNDNIDKYLLDTGIVLTDITISELKMIQRIHKVSGDAFSGAALLEEKLHSAVQIYSFGKARLKSAMEARGVIPSVAMQIYEKVTLQYAQILARMMDYRSEFHTAHPKSIISYTYSQAEIQDALGAIPDLATLFGSGDYCNCEHCKSMYSPAAYVADLLRFLGEHNSLINNSLGGKKSVREILFERRPDLGNIKLNCENTDVILPYIDLVCEILENAVSPDSALNFNYDSNHPAQELRAIPQYINSAAYNTLANSINYPMNSSFNFWQEQARVFLNFLRVPRWELMQAFQYDDDGIPLPDINGGPTNLIPKDVSIAAEYFGISSRETDFIITKRNTVASQNTFGFWGFDASLTLVGVSLFLDRSKLTYNELLELLLVNFLNPDGPDRMVIERPEDSCNVTEQTIINITPAKLDLMHRFIRLWRKTGYKMWELDLLLQNPKIGNNEINDDSLINLWLFNLCQVKLKLPLESLLCFYGDINTENRVQPDRPSTVILSYYHRLFQHGALNETVRQYFKIPGGDILNSPFLIGDIKAPPHLDKLPVVLSALYISENDFDLIADVNDTLTVSTISELLRKCLLARGLKISVPDLLILLAAQENFSPFDSPQSTFDFIQNYDWIKKSGVSISDLDYILRFNPDSFVGLRDETITQMIQELRDNLREITDSFTIETDEEKTEIITNRIVAVIASAFGITPEQSTSFLVMSATFDSVTATLLVHLNSADLIALDVDGEYALTIDRINFLKIYEAYTLLHKASIMVLQMELEIDQQRFFIAFHDEVNTVDLQSLPVDTTPDNFSNRFYQWLNLAKFIWFIKKFPEPEYISDTETETISLIKILNVAFTSNASLNSDQVAVDGFLQKLAVLTQWKFEDLHELHSRFNLIAFGSNSSYLIAEVFVHLFRCFSQMNLTGVGAITMFDWANRDNVSSMEQTAYGTLLAVKSKYEEQDWVKKITPLMDELRNKKRFALVEYLIEDSLRNQPTTIVVDTNTIPNPLYWKNSNSLFNYFLIDVEMSACQLTSRIKQAISSIQYFVQRCFLNLESYYVRVTGDQKKDVTSENSWAQWKWMKYYRIWEANRKVLFYPENWIEPELRDDKSPFFVELENEILQNEITDENTEAAFLSYLHKVNEVAHLQVCGLYHEVEDLYTEDETFNPEINILHVIGRTKTQPHVYYYRKFDLNIKAWSAWEKIEVDIVGDTLMPVIYNRKLYLFWLVINTKAIKVKKNPPPPASDSTSSSDAPEPQKMHEIQLAWSIHTKSGWTAKKVSTQKLVHPWERPLFSYNIKPRYKTLENQLWIDIFLSTSKEFNDTFFYDLYSHKKTLLTKIRYNQNQRPWNSSTFVFNGNVIDIKLKGLIGRYNLPYVTLDDDGAPVEQYSPFAVTSYHYVHQNFGHDGEILNNLTWSNHEVAPRLKLPVGMHYHFTRLTNSKVHASNRTNFNILENNRGFTLLTGAKDPFELVVSQQDLQMNNDASGNDRPFFYQDHERSFFIKPEWRALMEDYTVKVQVKKYNFFPFYHPYTTLFIRELNRSGIEGLLNRNIQVEPEEYYPQNTFDFNEYLPVDPNGPDSTAEKDIVDFSYSGAYSIYNWEMFFHVPMLIAGKLSQNQRFEEAMKWYHYIFDPTNIEDLPTPQRYWITKPFFEHNSNDYRIQRIENILTNLNQNMDQIIAWRNNPFKPHLIARFRPVAYQRCIVMKYIDNLIAWGDMLFRRDTLESINEASLIYTLANELLGEKPVKVPNVLHADKTFNEIQDDLDIMANALIEVRIEDTLNIPVTIVPSIPDVDALPKIQTLYFCIPNNDKLLTYWDTVADRLFKIRHCMNIKGVKRQLPLFEPPIDPALLVKAAAAGIDLSSVLNDLASAPANYRFRVTVQKAVEFCNEVKSLGE